MATIEGGLVCFGDDFTTGMLFPDGWTCIWHMFLTEKGGCSKKFLCNGNRCYDLSLLEWRQKTTLVLEYTKKLNKVSSTS